MLVAVHAGAGTHARSHEAAYRAACAAACAAACDAIRAGGSAVAAVEAAICVLEDDPVTNAGVGSNLNEDGDVEVDASMMEAATGAYGAVGAVPGLQNPIRAARALLEQGRQPELALGRLPPMLLCGDGARRWAQQRGVPVVDPADLVTERTRAQHARYRAALDAEEAEGSREARLWDTVGAICVDAAGHLASGVSSGGIALKRQGRVGEAAHYGAGCWAAVAGDAVVGTTTSGKGEQVIRTLLARTCASALANAPADDAPSVTLRTSMQTDFLGAPSLRGDPSRLAGVLAVVALPRTSSAAAEVLWAHSTPSMVVAYQTSTATNATVVVSRAPAGSRPEALVLGGQAVALTDVDDGLRPPAKRPRH